MPAVTERLLQLLRLLQTGRTYSGAELTQRLDVSARSLRRDVERLRSYGYRIDTQPGPHGFYRIASGNALPPLVLDEEETIATMAALALLAATGDEPGSLSETAARVAARIEQFLPTRLRARAVQTRTLTHTSRLNSPPVPIDTVASLTLAVHEHRQVAFDYIQRDSITHRVVDPHHLVHRNLRWYLIAWDADAGDWRTFRLDRIHDLQHGTRTFTPRPVPSGDIDTYLDEGFHRDRHHVALTVHANRADVAAALAFQEATLTDLGDGITRVELKLDDWRWILSSLAFLDAEFTIEEPAEFSDGLARFGSRLQRSRP